MRFAITLDHGRKLPQLKFLPDALRKLVVMLPVGILGPGIEAPVGKRNALLIPDKDWAGVACPDSVGRPDVKLYTLGIDMTALQDFARCLFLARRGDDQVYIFRATEMPDDIGKDPGNGVEFSRPVRAIVRPRQPCGLMRLPFGRHAIAKRAGRGLRIASRLRAHDQSKNLCVMPA